MVLIIETGKVYEEVFKEPVLADKPLLPCEPDVRKALQNYLKNTKPEALIENSELSFSTWNEFIEATKEMKGLPGSFFIKEIK